MCLIKQIANLSCKHTAQKCPLGLEVKRHYGKGTVNSVRHYRTCRRVEEVRHYGKGIWGEALWEGWTG